MATYISSSGYGVGVIGQTNIPVPKPTGLQVGDLMLGFIHSDGATVTAPAGWTMHAASLAVSNRLFWKIATSDDVAATSFTFSRSDNLGVAYCTIAALRGVHQTAPIEAAAGATINGSTTISLPSVTATSAKYLFSMVATTGNPTGYTPPASQTEAYDFSTQNQAARTAGGYDTSPVAAGATGTRTWSTPDSNNHRGYNILIAPLVIAPGSIAASSVVGNPQVSALAGKISPSSIQSTTQMGAPTVTATAKIVPAGAGPGTAVGSPTVMLDQQVAPSGIQLTTFGTPVFIFDQPVAPGGIPSTGSVGEPTVLSGVYVNLGVATESQAPQAPSMRYEVNGSRQPLLLDGLPGLFAGPSPMSLAIVEPDLERAPSTLTVNLTGADYWTAVTFKIDGATVWTAETDFEGEFADFTIDIPGDLAAGTHTLSATTTPNGTVTADFTLAYDPLPLPADSLDADAVAVPGSEGSWVLQDLMPGGLGSWIMPYNPSTMTHPHFEREVQVRHTTSPSDGQFLASEGRFVGRPWRISGTYLDEEYYNQLVRYATIRRRFYIIDHRGRAWKVGVVALRTEPRRVPDWMGSWSMDLVIYDQAPAVPTEA